MTTTTRNIIRDSNLRPEQTAAIERIAGAENQPMARVIRTLIDVGLLILFGELPS